MGRRFTPAGLLVVSGLVASGAIGIDLEQSVASQAFAILLCLLAFAMVAACFFRGRFAVQRVLPRFGTVGQPLVYSIVVRNGRAKALRDLEVLEDLADTRPTLEEFIAAQRAVSESRSFRLTKNSAPRPDYRRAVVKPQPLPALAPHSLVEAQAQILPLKRGPLRFEGVTIARPDPFGLFRAFVRVALPQTVLILPKRYPLPPLPLPGTMKYQQGGVALASSVGESEEFVSLRDYRPGDPLRHMHWRSWARTGRPIVREFQDEFFVRHALVLDTFAGPTRAAAFEEAVSIAASFACTINTQESLLDLMFVGPQAFCFTTGRGLGQGEQALEILASVQPCCAKPFAALRHLVLEHVANVSGCICILLEWDEPRQELARQLQAVGLPLLVLVVTDANSAKQIKLEAANDAPDNFHVLEVGKMAEGLRQLEGALL
jgi:uncharacterized protein (DUF58 family)